MDHLGWVSLVWLPVQQTLSTHTNYIYMLANYVYSICTTLLYILYKNPCYIITSPFLWRWDLNSMHQQKGT